MSDPNVVPNMVLQATGPKYLKDGWDETVRTSPMLALLHSGGRIVGEDAVAKIVRRVRYKKSLGRGYQRGANIGYSPHDEHLTVEFGMRHMMNDDSIDLQDIAQNSGPNKMADLFTEKYPLLVDGMKERLQRGCFLDGNASGNEDQLSGLETIFTQDSSVTVAAADKIAIPTLTYLGQPTKPGTKGGTWSSDLGTSPNAEWDNDWPFGSGDVQYDFWSPKLFHVLSEAWNNTTDTWKDNSLDILTAMIQTIELSSGSGMIPKYVPMGDSYMLDFKAKLRANQREILPHKAGVDLGFNEAINFEGAMTMKDFFCPSDAAYAVNPNAMELCCWKNPPAGFDNVTRGGEGYLFGFGPTKNPLGTWYGMAVFFFGEMWMRPKHFAKASDFTQA